MKAAVTVISYRINYCQEWWTVDFRRGANGQWRAAAFTDDYDTDWNASPRFKPSQALAVEMMKEAAKRRVEDRPNKEPA